MNVLRYLTLAASLAVVACGGPDTESPTGGVIDEEYGAVDWERADNAVARPGSAEGVATLEYVNQPLDSTAEATRFRTELETRLDPRVAASIIDARLGNDGVPGTGDDRQFEHLHDLDLLRWVGRGVLLELFRLAMDAGYFQPPIPCEEVFGLPIGDPVTFRTLAELVELGNSACDRFDGDVIIDVNTTLLPIERSLRAFDAVREIHGSLVLGPNAGLETLAFRRLGYVATIDTDDFEVHAGGSVAFPVLHRIDTLTTANQSRYFFDALQSADTVTVVNHPGTFPSLRYVEDLTIEGDVVAGFEALQSAERIGALITQSLTGFGALEEAKHVSVNNKETKALRVDAFQSLREAHSVTIGFWKRYNGRHDRFRSPRLEFAGLPSAEKITSLTLEGGSNADFPRLSDCYSIHVSHGFAGNFPRCESAHYVYADVEGRFPFPVLETVTDHFLIDGSAPLTHSPLRTVGNHFEVTTVSDFSALESIGGKAEITHAGGDWSGLHAVDSIIGSIEVICTGGSMELLNGLGNLAAEPRWYMDASENTERSRIVSFDISRCKVSGLEQVREMEERHTFVDLTGKEGQFEALGALEITNSVKIDDDSELAFAPFPSLRHIDGDLTIDRDSYDRNAVRGFDALDTVTENVTISNRRRVRWVAGAGNYRWSGTSLAGRHASGRARRIPWASPAVFR